MHARVATGGYCPKGGGAVDLAVVDVQGQVAARSQIQPMQAALRGRWVGIARSAIAIQSAVSGISSRGDMPSGVARGEGIVACKPPLP